MTSDLLDVEEAAAFLHIKTCTVRDWVYKQKIPYVKLGRRVFLRHGDLVELIDRSLVPADGQAKKGSSSCR
ncbi:MAG: helix-turn-helix domain-containing protein [Candidatus Sulfotelmatobacter sp.]